MTNGTNGHIDPEDNDRWVERTGWAPRFGNGPIDPVTEGDSIADHQTWMEANLDDKFFGGRFVSGSTFGMVLMGNRLVP